MLQLITQGFIQDFSKRGEGGRGDHLALPTCVYYQCFDTFGKVAYLFVATAVTLLLFMPCADLKRGGRDFPPV